MRAVENGRFVVLATNTGISAVIDPAGVVTSVSYPGKRGSLIDTVQFLYGQTPFSKMWWL
jgi:apolipoprotein N-acyltransferase